MKLASRRGGRDGALVVVSRDLTRAADASAVAPTMQAALDDWEIVAPKLDDLYRALDDGSRGVGEPLDLGELGPVLDLTIGRVREGGVADDEERPSIVSIIAGWAIEEVFGLSFWFVDLADWDGHVGVDE